MLAMWCPCCKLVRGQLVKKTHANPCVMTVTFSLVPKIYEISIFNVQYIMLIYCHSDCTKYCYFTVPHYIYFGGPQAWNSSLKVRATNALRNEWNSHIDVSPADDICQCKSYNKLWLIIVSNFHAVKCLHMNTFHLCSWYSVKHFPLTICYI